MGDLRDPGEGDRWVGGGGWRPSGKYGLICLKRKSDTLYSNVKLIFEPGRAWGGPGGPRGGPVELVMVQNHLVAYVYSSSTLKIFGPSSLNSVPHSTFSAEI